MNRLGFFTTTLFLTFSWPSIAAEFINPGLNPHELADKSPTVRLFLSEIKKIDKNSDVQVERCIKGDKELESFDCQDKEIAILAGIERDVVKLKNLKIIPFAAENIKFNSAKAHELLKGCAKLPFDKEYSRWLDGPYDGVSYSNLNDHRAQDLSIVKYIFNGNEMIAIFSRFDKVLKMYQLPAALCESEQNPAQMLELLKAAKVQTSTHYLANALVIAYRNRLFLLDFLTYKDGTFMIDINNISDYTSPVDSKYGYFIRHGFKDALLKRLRFQLKPNPRPRAPLDLLK